MPPSMTSCEAGGGRARRRTDELVSGPCGPAARRSALWLVDGIGEIRGVLRPRYGDKVRSVLVPPAWLAARALLAPPRSGTRRSGERSRAYRALIRDTETGARRAA